MLWSSLRVCNSCDTRSTHLAGSAGAAATAIATAGVRAESTMPHSPRVVSI